MPDDDHKTYYVETATEESILDESNAKVITEAVQPMTHLEEGPALCYFSASWEPDVEPSETITIMIGTPQYHDNTLVEIDKSDIQYERLENIDVAFATATNEQAEPETLDVDSSEESDKTTFLLETPEYHSNQLVTCDLNSEVEYLADTDENVEVQENVSMSEAMPEECQSKVALLVETPEYHDNKLIEVTSNEDIDTADVEFCVDSSENVELEEEVEENSAPKTKVVMMIETPEYQDNQVIEVESEEQVSVEDLEVDYCAEFAEKRKEDCMDNQLQEPPFYMPPRKKLILCVETPEYNINQLVQVDADEFCCSDTATSIEFIASEENFSPDEEAESDTVVLCVEGPEYYQNRLVQVKLVDGELESLEVDYNGQTADAMEKSAEVETESANEEPKKLVVLVETPEYQQNQIVEVDSEDIIEISTADVDFHTSTDEEPVEAPEPVVAHCRAALSNEPNEIISNAWDRQKLILCLETPSYFDNVMLQVDYETFIKSCEACDAEYAFASDLEVSENTGKLVMCVETPSYFTNRLIEVDLESVVESFESSPIDYQVESLEILEDESDDQTLQAISTEPAELSGKLVQKLTVCVGDKMGEVDRDNFVAQPAETDLDYCSSTFYESFETGSKSQVSKKSTTPELSAHLCYFSDEYKYVCDSLVMMIETESGNKILQVQMSADDLMEVPVDFIAATGDITADATSGQGYVA